VGPNTTWREIQWTKVRVLIRIFGLRPWYCGWWPEVSPLLLLLLCCMVQTAGVLVTRLCRCLCWFIAKLCMNASMQACTRVYSCGCRY
jgi:hypothetical protein